VSAPACPDCGTEIQADWDWCYKCGFDPDNLRPDHVGPKPPDFGESEVESERVPVQAPVPVHVPEPPPPDRPTDKGPQFSPPPHDRPNAVLIISCVLILLTLALGAVVLVSRSTQPPPPLDDNAAGTPNALAKKQEGPKLLTTTTAPEWRSFSPAGAGFTVELPGTPTEQSRTVRLATTETPLTVHQYSVGNDEENPMGAGYFDLPPNVPFDTDQVARDLGRVYGGAVQDITPVNYAGLEGIDFTILSQLVRVRQRMLKAGNRIYVLFAGRKLADATGSEVDFIRLTNSLQLG